MRPDLCSETGLPPSPSVRIFLLLPLLVLVACAPARADRSIPFVPLATPDTLRTAADLAGLMHAAPVVNVNHRGIHHPAEPMEEGSAFLVKRSGEGWLAFPLPLYKDRQSDFELQRFSPDGRFLIAEQRSTDFTRGQERNEVELYLIDLERLTYASVTTLVDNFEWEIDANDRQLDHRTRDSSVVSITDSHLHLVNGCTVNGQPVPCQEPSLSYAITPGALVPDSSISIRPVITGASQLPAPPGGWDRHALLRDHRSCPGPMHAGMAAAVVDEEARNRLLQFAASDYAGSTLRFGNKLPFDNGLRITLFCDRDDDHDLLWLSYDQLGVLQGVDTLASTYGDGQYAVSECIYLSPYGQLLVESAHRETLRDDVDTMAYRCDTLVYEPVIEQFGFLAGSGEVEYRYQLRRRLVDGTRCWVEKHSVDARPPYPWHSLREVIPAGRVVFQQASGDLNKDGAEDHVVVLTNAADDGPRDLLIAFTAPDRGRFLTHALLKDFLPEKHSGGFHDPIGEEGISGISIRQDTLVITQFGGSAWKWTSTDKYAYDPSSHAFFLVETGGRSFHAAAEDGQAEELQELETLRTKQELNKDQMARYAELKELAEKATWKATRYPLGTKPVVK